MQGLAREGRLQQCLVLTPGRQLELRAEPDPVVGMGQPLGQITIRALRKARREQGLGLAHQVRRRVAGVGEAVDAALAHRLPAVEPVEQPERPVRTPVAVGRVDRPDELLVVDDLEARPLGLVLELPQSGAAGAAPEIAQREGVVPLGAAAGTLVVAHATGSGRDVLDRRREVGRLGVILRVPHLLGVPGPAGIGGAASLEELPPDAPTAVAALDEPGPSGLVAAVRVVVAGEQVAPGVEDHVLGVAQALIDHLEAGAIGLAAEHRPAVGGADRAALALDHRGAVADGEVQPPVGAEGEPVQVVPEESHADAVAVADAAPFVGDAVAIGVPQPPDVRDVGEEHVATARQHAGGHTVQRRGEVLGEHRGDGGLAGALRVPQQAHPLGVGVVPGHLVGLEVALHHHQPVVDRLAGQVLVEPVHDAADVGHAAPRPETLGHEDAPVIGHVEGHAVRHVGLGRPQLGLPALRVGEPFDRPFALVGGGGDGRGLEGGLLWTQLVLGEGGRRAGGGPEGDGGGQATAQEGGRDRHKTPEGMGDAG